MTTEFITPYSAQALRLMREKWANPTQLAEEVFAVFQKPIPTTLGKTTINVAAGAPEDSSMLTLNNFGDGNFINFRDRYGNSMFRIDQFGNAFIAGEVFQIGTQPDPGETRSQSKQRRPNDPQFNRVKPIIDWATPDPIITGTALSGTQLNAIARDPLSEKPVEGDFEYTPGSGTILAEGEHTLSTVFTPRDRNIYLRASATVQLTVTDDKIDTHIVVVGGTSFLDTSPAFNFSYADQGGFTGVFEARDDDDNVIAGTFVFTPDEGSTPDIDAPTLHVEFTPDNTDTYNSCDDDIGMSITRPTLDFSGTITSANPDGSDPVGADGDVADFGFGDIPITGITMLFDTDQPGNVQATDGNIGQPVAALFDFTDEEWYYTFFPS